MDQPPIFFISGLPRSGSTLLSNLLGQNPRHHVTPTNALLEMITLVRDHWQTPPEFRAQGIANVQPRITSMMRSMVDGFYAPEFKAGKVVFDKNRGWLAYIEMMEEILQRPITVLVTVRDIRAIVASFEKIFRKYPLNIRRPVNSFTGQTTAGRATLSLSEEGAIGLPINRLRDALIRTHKSRIWMIPYNDLCRHPREVLKGLHDKLGLPPFSYDPDSVQQITEEDDSVYGGAPESLHTIRSKVELKDEKPWEGILPDALCERLIQDYPDIQKYSEGK